MAAAAPPADPVSLLTALSGGDIRRRLAALEAERASLIVLLRSIAARERTERRASDRGTGRAERAAPQGGWR